jgi:hypothetical protein
VSDAISAASVLAFLSRPSSPGADVEATDAGPYRDAAAVLAAIEHPENLQPVGGGPRADITALLGADLIPATGRKFRGRVMLNPAARYEALAGLAKRRAIDAALAVNLAEQTGPVQDQLRRYLLGRAPALEVQTLEELEATRQVAAWVRDAVPGVPSPDAVAARSAYLHLLAPFEALAGDAVFRGRKHELDELRAFVGVLPVSSLLGRLAAKTLHWVQPAAKPALSLHGPGGVGKSALIARFMLEHVRLPDGGRIPFAYLDFDRAGLDVAAPYGLVTEMIRQLAAQFPLDRFEQMQALVDARSATRGTPGREHAGRRVGAGQVREAEAVLGDTLATMTEVLGPRPYVVVLDTFEEVQFRGEARAFPLWEMLDRLQQRWPVLRVIVAGRAPVETLRLGGHPPRPMGLGDLDTEAAMAFLAAQGVKDPVLARRLVDRYGGVPLSLKLVASLAREPDEDTAQLAAGGRIRSLARVGNEVVQGQLYERVLAHVHDERVRRLAHPGLVLRRITPEVILEVLDGPCELGITDIDAATDLFEALRRETSLMSVDDADGSLVHRSDLRRVMLRLLMTSEPGRVLRIRQAAVAYYGAMGGRRGDAEVAYHRLHLGEDVEEAAFKDPEVRSSIQASIMEFDPAVQRRLATLGFRVAADVLELASRDEQEQAIAARVEAYLPNGPQAWSAALALLRDQAARLDHPSPLFRAWARVLIQTGDHTGAADWIAHGLEQAGIANDARQGMDLLVERAWLEQLDAGQAASATVVSLAEAAMRHEDPRTRLLARLLAFHRDDPEVATQLDGLAGVLGQATPDDVWALLPALRGVVEAAVEHGTSGVLAAVQEQVMNPGGPFGLVYVGDPGTQRRLEDVLSQGRDSAAFGRAFVGLLAAWPFQILSVQPPYGRQGMELSESAS